MTTYCMGENRLYPKPMVTQNLNNLRICYIHVMVKCVFKMCMHEQIKGNSLETNTSNIKSAAKSLCCFDKHQYSGHHVDCIFW